jgi:hypothetical protein
MDGGSEESRAGRARRYLAGTGRALGAALLAIGAVVLWQKLSDPYGAFDGSGEHVLLAAGLIVGGIFLLRDDPTVRGLQFKRDAVARRRRTRSPLGLFTLAGAFMTLGTAIVLGNLDILTLSVGQLTALAMVVVGAGMLVGAWWGRARWLMLIGVLLIPAVMVTGYIDMPPRGQVGSIYLHATSGSELASRYNLLFGTMTIDMMDMRRLTGTKFINVNVAAGNVTLYVPEHLNLRVAGHIELGNTTLGSGYQDGEDLSFSRVYEGRRGQGTLDVDVNGGIASLYVERISYREWHGPRRKGKEPGRARRGSERDAKDSGDRSGAGRDGRERRGGRDGRGKP